MEQIINELNTTITDFLSATANTITDWEIRPGVNKWSKKEIIGHLTDSAQINLQRFVRCTYETDFKLIYFQEEWVIAQRYQEIPVNELLELWRLLNSQIARVLGNYPQERLRSRCDNSRNNVALHDVRFLAQDYVEHLKHHLNQIIN